MWYVGLLAVVLLVLGGFLTLRLHAGLIHGLDDSLATRAAQISLGLQGGCEGEFQDVSDASLVGLPQGESGAQLLSTDGKVMESAGDRAAEQALLTVDQLRSVAAGRALRGTVRSGRTARPSACSRLPFPRGRAPG